eukprot:7254705-Prymnesium_polylepis.1
MSPESAYAPPLQLRGGSTENLAARQHQLAHRARKARTHCHQEHVTTYDALQVREQSAYKQLTACNHQHEEGQTSCQPCSAGEHQPERGEATCIPCPTGRHAAVGSAQCSICAEEYYRPSADSPATECTACNAIPGVSCGLNATIATLNMTTGHWRHSTATAETFLCRSDGSWTPCTGGADAGVDGDGYCADGYRGPRCELCDGPAHSRHFHRLQARCDDCGDVSGRTVAISSAALLVALAYFGLDSAAVRTKGSTACGALLGGIRYAQAIWQAAGMRYKVKALVGFYQCIAAVPSAFDVVPPLGLEDYTRWIDLFELPSELENIFIPAACMGNYRTRLLIGSLWPVGLVLLVAAGVIGWELLQGCRRKTDRSPRGLLSACHAGLQRVLPFTLGLTFLVVPSTSMRIFRTFACETFQYDDDASRRYLYADLTLSCDSD